MHPVLEYIPQDIVDYFGKQCDDPVLSASLAIYEFTKRLIDHVADIVPAVKPQLAYYEKYGSHGMRALQRTIQYAGKAGMLIADGKRNDIGSTADAYASAAAKIFCPTTAAPMFDADALTVNAYLGLDGIKPFIAVCRKKGKGIFVLVRTSNPSAGDVQDLILSDGRTVYEAMAAKVAEWGDDLITAHAVTRRSSRGWSHVAASGSQTSQVDAEVFYSRARLWRARSKRR